MRSEASGGRGEGVKKSNYRPSGSGVGKESKAKTRTGQARTAHAGTRH